MSFTDQILARLQRRVANLIIRALVTADSAATRMQLVQVGGRAGETKDGLEHWLPYGFAFRAMPPEADGRGAEVLVLAIEPDLRVALPAADRRYPPPVALTPGETILYDRLGKFVHLGADGTLHIKAPRIVLEADHIEVNAEEDIRLWAGTSYRLDVHGYAQQLEWTAGTVWHNVNWTIGATFDPATTNAIEPPKVDDE